jgi:hypothetical protein
MSNRINIEQRVIKAAQEALQRQNYVSIIDVFVGMRLLEYVHVQAWRKGRIPYLEKVIQGNLNKISFATECFHRWAKAAGLNKKETVYLAQTRGPRQELQFSKSGNHRMEAAYRTHYVSPILSEKKQQKILESVAKPPELVVFLPLKTASCAQCGKELSSGNFLFLEGDRTLCLDCAGLGELEFLPSGDAMLSRRAKKYSTKYAVVVKFSRSRKRYERQGLLVQPEALKKAQNECA